MKLSRGELFGILGAVVAVAGIALWQPSLAKENDTLRLRSDVHTLPPPAHMQKLAFGYNASIADLLWAKVLVEQGLHWQEKRRFDEMPSYLDGILALEPRFKTVYEYVDTLMLMQYEPGSPEDARRVRGYLERGTRELPYDPEIWLHYGQYLAFLAPSYLKEKSEIDQWRVDGANALARAVELGADADRSLSAATLLDKAGQRKAAVAQLQRAYALADNPETRRQIRLRLQRMNAQIEAEDTLDAVETLHQESYPFLSRDSVLLIGPRVNPARCAGPSSRADAECARSWSEHR
jgi:hypothetical protein